MRTLTTTVVQNVSSPKRIETSSMKSLLKKNEYTKIHRSITTDDPIQAIHVITVQLTKDQFHVLPPANM